MDQSEINDALEKNIPLSQVVENNEFDINECKYNVNWEQEFLFDPEITEEGKN